MGHRTKHNHIFYNPNRAKAKSGDKYKKAIKWYLDLLEKKEKHGDTKWIQKTLEKANERLKKFGVTNEMIDEYRK